jgi:uncharacterized repeat protein (TIGR01451 family)
MKRITVRVLVKIFLMTLMTTPPVVAQMTWKDASLYFGLNQNLALPLLLKSDSSSVWVEQGFTVYAPKPVSGDKGHDLIKKGGGRFWFRADTKYYLNANIVYKGKADTVQLDGIFGPYINASTGYLYTGNLISSSDSTSFFYLNQKDTVVQTFVAKGYNNRNINLHIYSATKSKLRLTRSSDSLAGRIDIPHGGTLYIDGTYNARVFVKDGKLITGEDSTGGSVHQDYARFSEFVKTNVATFTDSAAIVVENSIMQIGAYNDRPSLAFVDSGHVIQRNHSILEIDVYDPGAVYTNVSNISGESFQLIDKAWTESFSDRIYLKSGNYKFEQPGDTIKAKWSAAYRTLIANDTVFYLPVIMLRNKSGVPQQIMGGNNVTVKQTLPGWVLEFYIEKEAGIIGRPQGWGYIRGRKIFMKKDATLKSVQDNGTYPNPVSVLYKDIISYKITVYNPGEVSASMITVVDTLPPYLDYVPSSMQGSASSSSISIGKDVFGAPGNPEQHLVWTVTGVVPSLDTVRLWYEATPASGACASQPLYINKAYIKIKDILGDSAMVETNKTYHQGAGISIVTFSASVGGQLFNAREQALDYRTSPRSGLLILPDSGYTFAGWSHDEYISLRGEKIKADSGMMHYEDVVIYGSVELRANFVPTVKKSDEKIIVQEKITENSDKVWSYDKDLYIRTKIGKIARIYTTEGILQRQLDITADGTTTVRLEQGVYIVTLDGGAGWKVVIE